MNTCMECHREPEPFQDDNGNTVWWMVIPKGMDEPTILMSDLSTRFVVCPSREYEAKDWEVFWCIDCFQKIFDTDE
jgi:hypothetical protein